MVAEKLKQIRESGDVHVLAGTRGVIVQSHFHTVDRLEGQSRQVEHLGMFRDFSVQLDDALDDGIHCDSMSHDSRTTTRRDLVFVSCDFGALATIDET
jgi:hypothetical protein